MILFDTCVISEAIKPTPSEAVLAWIAELPEERAWGSLLAGLEAKGRVMTLMDRLIAVVALSRQATLSTRNTVHFPAFKDIGLNVINPWLED